MRMGKRFPEYYPPATELINLPPDAIAQFMLLHLCDMDNQFSVSSFGRYNYLNSNEIIDFAREARVNVDPIMKLLAQGWLWLENEGLICPRPDQPTGDFYFVTEKGVRFREPRDFQSYRKGKFLPHEILDKVLLEKVYPLFISGDYDTAVFRAFKEIEVRVRQKSGMPQSAIGIDLMRMAFNPEKGFLASKDIHKAEKQALSDLYAGGIGIFKNPSSHREVKFEEAEDVAKIILFADYLLKLLERF
jgi:uncharacterized protein (TIGR02391 family)